jgi:hypothetical protein
VTTVVLKEERKQANRFYVGQEKGIEGIWNWNIGHWGLALEVGTRGPMESSDIQQKIV